jgi:hypothetical protein
MKYLLLLLLFFSTQAFAQTHQNQTMRLTWLGQGVVQVDNLMNCDATVRIAFVGRNHSTDTVVVIKSLTTVYHSLMPLPIEIKIKADGTCHTHGWIHLYPPDVLSIQDTRMRPPVQERHFFDLYVSQGKLYMSGTYKERVNWFAYDYSGRLLGKGTSKVGVVSLPPNTSIVQVHSHLFNYTVKH